MRTRIIVAGLLCLLAPVCSPVAAQQLLFTAIDVQPAAINDMAETVGSFRTPGLTGDCFDPGTCSSAPSDFCVAGAAPNPPLAVAFCGPVVDGTFCISSDGWIVGSCVYDPVGKDHGFLRSADGSSLTTIDLPRAAGVFNFTGINDAGQIVGFEIGAFLLVVGLALAFNLWNCPGALARWHDRTRGSVPRWIREGPSTWSLDAGGLRLFGGVMAAAGV